MPLLRPKANALKEAWGLPSFQLCNRETSEQSTVVRSLAIFVGFYWCSFGFGFYKNPSEENLLLLRWSGYFEWRTSPGEGHFFLVPLLWYWPSV